jgi:hypothetical protein
VVGRPFAGSGTSKGYAVAVTTLARIVFRMSNAHRITRPSRVFSARCPLPRVQAPHKVLILRCTSKLVPGGDSLVLRLSRVRLCELVEACPHAPRLNSRVMPSSAGRSCGRPGRKTILVPISKHLVKHIAAVLDAGTVSRPARCGGLQPLSAPVLSLSLWGRPVRPSGRCVCVARKHNLQS